MDVRGLNDDRKASSFIRHPFQQLYIFRLGDVFSAIDTFVFHILMLLQSKMNRYECIINFFTMTEIYGNRNDKKKNVADFLLFFYSIYHAYFRVAKSLDSTKSLLTCVNLFPSKKFLKFKK